MGTSSITICFEEAGNFLKSQLTSIVPPRNSGVHTSTLTILVLIILVYIEFYLRVPFPCKYP